MNYHPQYAYAHPYYDGHYPAYHQVGAVPSWWGHPDLAQAELARREAAAQTESDTAPSFGNWKDILIGAAIGVAGILVLRRVL